MSVISVRPASISGSNAHVVTSSRSDNDSVSNLVPALAIGAGAAIVGALVARHTLHSAGWPGSIDWNFRRAQSAAESVIRRSQAHLDARPLGVSRVDWDFLSHGQNEFNTHNLLPWSTGAAIRRAHRHADRAVNGLLRTSPEMTTTVRVPEESLGSLLMGLMSEGNPHYRMVDMRLYDPTIARVIGADHSLRMVTSSSRSIEHATELRSALDQLPGRAFWYVDADERIRLATRAELAAGIEARMAGQIR